MARTQGYRDLEVNEPNLSMGYFTFVTVTSGNPTIYGGKGVRGIVRTAAGRYEVTIDGVYAGLTACGPAILGSGASKNFNGHFELPVTDADANTTTIPMVILDGTTESDLGGAGAVTVVYFASQYELVGS